MLQAVCLGVRFVSTQKMSLGSWTPTCSWLFAGIQSLSLPGLVQLPNPNHFPQGWRGMEGLAQAGRGDREGERLEWGRGYWGAGCRRRIESGQSQLGQRARPGMDTCTENKGRASSLPLCFPTYVLPAAPTSEKSQPPLPQSAQGPVLFPGLREDAGLLHPRGGCLIPYLVL